jgi:hypothetical protein
MRQHRHFPKQFATRTNVDGVMTTVHVLTCPCMYGTSDKGPNRKFRSRAARDREALQHA